MIQLNAGITGAPLLNATKGATITCLDSVSVPAPASRSWSVRTGPSDLTSMPTVTGATGISATFVTDASLDACGYLVQLIRTEVDGTTNVQFALVGVPDVHGNILPPPGSDLSCFNVDGAHTPANPSAAMDHGYMGTARGSVPTNFLLEKVIRTAYADAEAAIGGALPAAIGTWAVAPTTGDPGQLLIRDDTQSGFEIKEASSILLGLTFSDVVIGGAGAPNVEVSSAGLKLYLNAGHEIYCDTVAGHSSLNLVGPDCTVGGLSGGDVTLQPGRGHTGTDQQGDVVLQYGAPVNNLSGGLILRDASSPFLSIREHLASTGPVLGTNWQSVVYNVELVFAVGTEASNTQALSITPSSVSPLVPLLWPKGVAPVLGQIQSTTGAGSAFSLYAQQGLAGNTGGTLRLGGGLGGTPGTNAAGALWLDGGATVGGTSARTSFVAGGASFLDVYRVTAGGVIAPQVALTMTPAVPGSGAGLAVSLYAGQGFTGNIGGAMTLGGGAGATSGTNLAGPTRIDLGTPVSNVSARAQFWANGASILDIYQPSANAAAIQQKTGTVLVIGDNSAGSSLALQANTTIGSESGGNSTYSAYSGSLFLQSFARTNVVTLDTGANLLFWGGAGLGSGAHVNSVANCTTAPTANPTGGGIEYYQGGAKKIRTPGGFTKTVAPA